MQIIFFLGALFMTPALSFAVAASPGPVSPSPAASATPAEQSESPEVTAAARSTYAELVSGALDRSKFTSELNNALTDSLAQTISSQLSALGQPQWHFYKRLNTPKGNVSIYRLTWPTVTLDYEFGLNEKGQVWALMLSPEHPQH